MKDLLFCFEKNIAHQKSIQAAFHPGLVLPPCGEGSPFEYHRGSINTCYTASKFYLIPELFWVFLASLITENTIRRIRHYCTPPPLTIQQKPNIKNKNEAL